LHQFSIKTSHQNQPTKTNTTKHLVLLSCAIFLTMVFTVSARAKQQVELTPEGHKLLQSYTKILNDLKKDITKNAPVVDEQKKNSFIKFHDIIAKIPKRPNPKNLKMAPVTYSKGYPPYASAQGNALLAARVLFKEKEVDTFLKSEKMHAKLAKCALLRSGAQEMALFAQIGKEEKSYVDMLLGDDKLIIEVMELGGAYQNKYGQSIRNYKAIQKASKNSDKEFFRMWALASSLEHPEGSHVPEGKTAAQAMVKYYLNYEKAFLDGELDSAFGTLPSWECRFIFPFVAVEEVVWLRKMIKNYRPDHMKLDYKWRYCKITKSDVPYTSNVSRPVRPDLGLSRMQDFFLEGGICGPRAFSGRAATHAFGIPSRPAPQTGHAAMSHWTPEGWITVFGAHWTFNHFRGQCGLDFELESRVRRIPEDYKQVHRANWLGDAYDEKIVARMAFGLGGGFWKALAHYKKLATVEDQDLLEAESVGAEFAESNVAALSPNSDWTEEDGPSQEVSTVPQIKLSDADRTITTDNNGMIHIPVAACAPSESTEKIRFMKSYDDSFVQVHYSLGSTAPELLKYTINLPKAGKYAVTSKVVSVTVDRSFLLRVNRRTLYDIDVPLSMGDWIETKPVTIDLKEGRNKLLFTIKQPNKGLSLRSFTLKPIL